MLNACYNMVDRHVEAGKGGKNSLKGTILQIKKQSFGIVLLPTALRA
jgi:hypothetical protein